MSRWIVTGIFAVLAAASVVTSVSAWSDALADPSARAWSIAGFVGLRTAVLFAVSVCVFTRRPPRQHSRDPLAFLACGVALSAVPLLERPSDAAATALVVAGDLVALGAWTWLLVSFATLGRCFGLLPEARGLVTRGPYRLVRHPVYLGEFAAVAGLVLASATARNVGLALAFVAAQTVRMRLEERALSDEFPEYAVYARQTPRLLPRLRPRWRTGRSAAVAGACLFAVLVSAPMAATAPAKGLRAPVTVAPVAGARTDGVPWFAWAPVAGAAQYEFQIAADAGMNAPVLGVGQDRFFTKNTRATIKKSLPDRTYWWRVRASTAKGAVSPWTAPRAFTKVLSAPRPQSPVGGVGVSYPATPLKLTWSPVDRAAKYLVTIAADPALGTVIGGKPVETFATAFTRAGALAPGTYYWGVTPVDAQGNPGAPSPVASFAWVWPSTTSVRVDDLIAAPEAFDPQFSWDPIPGAARYEVEVNPSQDFAPGSKVCCVGTTIGTVFSPTAVLKDNRYYWRVRGYDVDGNPGVWNDGPVFDKRFDKVPPVADTSIKNVRMRDNLADPGVDADPATPAYETNVPLIRWDPVPGASSYQVEVTPMGPSGCNWTAPGFDGHWVVNTTAAAWSPLGAGWNFVRPYPDAMSVATDLPALRRYETYCARVRARSNRDSGGGEVYGDYTYVANGLASSAPAPSFKWMGYPNGGACSPSCNLDYLGPADYAVPQAGTVSVRTPYFTWRPLTRPRVALVNGDGQTALTVYQQAASITSLQVREHLADTGYDELYVSGVVNGLLRNEVYAFPDDADLSDFTQLARELNGLAPYSGSLLVSASASGAGPLVHVTNPSWTPGAMSYFVLVAKDAQFSNVVDYAFTQVPAYSPRSLLKPTSYPDETTSYYWVVLPAHQMNGGQAVGAPLLGASQAFEKRSTPPDRLEPASGADINGHPTFRWTSVEGARRYRLQVAQDDHFGTLLEDVLTDSTAYTSNTTYPADTVLYWRVRADDENLIGLTWSTSGTFQKRLATPRVTPGLPTSGDYIPTWTWDPIPGTVSYDVHVDLPDGTQRDITGLRTAALTPVIMYGTGVFRWKVRANFPRQPFGTVAGPYSPTHVFTRTIAEPTGVRSDSSKKYPLLLWDPKPGPKNYRVQISTRADFATLVEDVLTDNTNHAPLLVHPAYAAGGALYWRIAAMDEGRNTGDWSPVQQIGVVRRLRLTARGAPKRKRIRTIVITVRGAGNARVAGAAVRMSGAGARAGIARTNRKGTATFRVRATKRGAVVFQATKSGYQSATLRLRVR
ncbi:MAG TPA: isoprenylcysteine carboxylmethyltransferase family protein [Gaiellaceae bacterium]|nr:isoprenylcysteine carboxylmethyltransferase family protein [Gaiellaceae bacterium]